MGLADVAATCCSMARQKLAKVEFFILCCTQKVKRRKNRTIHHCRTGSGGVNSSGRRTSLRRVPKHFCFVHREHPVRLGLQRFLFSDLAVLCPANIAATKHTIAVSHNISVTTSDETRHPRYGVVVALLSNLLTFYAGNCLEILNKPFNYNGSRLEARVGIGQSMIAFTFRPVQS